MADFERLDDNSLKGALEALLLVSSEAVSAIDLAKTLGVAPGDAAAALAWLSFVVISTILTSAMLPLL